MEDQFYNDLKSKLASGALTHEQFKALIEEHLSKMNGTIANQRQPTRKQVEKLCTCR